MPETKKQQESMLVMNPSLYARKWFNQSALPRTIPLKISDTKHIKPELLKKNLTQNAIDTLKHAQELLKKRFLSDNDGALYVGGYALIIDEIIIALFNKIIDSMPQEIDSPKLTIMATGGYGRGELCPKSDIDLLFLTSTQGDKSVANIIEMMLYILWDIGLDVGHAVRSARQQIKAVQDDITIRTAFLEARYLAGDSTLASDTLSRFKSDIVQGSASQFLDAKLKERDAKFERNDTRRYMVEPDIKDGKGGLRDLHTLFWIARYAYQAESMDDLIERGILGKSELNEFAQAQKFLWSVRVHLHLRAGRQDDRLSFDAQMDIAPLLGFQNRKGMKNVERFMRRYHLAAKTVGNLTRIFWTAIATDFMTSSQSAPQPAPESFPVESFFVEPFIVEAGHLNLPDRYSLQENPQTIMQIFLIAQNEALNIHPKLMRKLHRNLKLIDDKFRKNPLFNTQFIEVLSHAENPERVLRLMNESGFLGKFLPDFGRIVAMMQFDMYHSYTVDEHTVFALGILSGIETGRLAEIAPIATAAVKEITLRKELYVALLLHDIAKGRGGDHSILGANVARKLCPRFGLSADQTETVAWLVRHHLLMSNTAFRYDLNDPTTIEQFAGKIQSPERLNLLLVLTVADIRAVGPNVWNDWKAQLMRDLYTRTMAVLRGDTTDQMLFGLAEAAKEHLRSTLAPDWPTREIKKHLDSFYPAYWTSFARDAYPRHAELCRKHLKSRKNLTLAITPDTKRNATELVIITSDNEGVFSRITGGVATTGANIVDARITTRKDGLIVDALWVQDKNSQAITEQNELDKIHNAIIDALAERLDIDAATQRKNRQTPSRIRRISAPARVLLNNNVSTTHTVIEINGKDAPALLFKVTRKIAEMGLQIQSASVSTYGDRVVDVFYVMDTSGRKITDKDRIQLIQKNLLTLLQKSDPANQIAA